MASAYLYIFSSQFYLNKIHYNIKHEGFKAKFDMTAYSLIPRCHHTIWRNLFLSDQCTQYKNYHLNPTHTHKMTYTKIIDIFSTWANTVSFVEAIFDRFKRRTNFCLYFRGHHNHHHCRVVIIIFCLRPTIRWDTNHKVYKIIFLGNTQLKLLLHPPIRYARSQIPNIWLSRVLL